MKRKELAARAQRLAPEVFWLPLKGCNVYFVGSRSQWVLIDTGWPGSAEGIRGAGESLFGQGARPVAVLLTHAHPDHYGSAAELARVWDSPLYAHRDDLPYLEGGLLPGHLLDPAGKVFAVVQRVLPRRTVARMTSSALRGIAVPLPEADLSVLGLPDWEYVHVPGHSPGHVVYFRARDRVLLADDAVLTAPFWGLLSRVQRLSLPPWMVSWDWGLTKRAIGMLADLGPRVLASGHGVPMTGEAVADRLRRFTARSSRS